MPVQDFGNAFSTFIAQNFGAGKYDRIKDGIKKALKSVVLFCIFISAIVFIFAKPLMMIFGKCRKHGDYKHRRTVFAYRGGLLYRHRYFVYALRILQNYK